MCLLLIVNVSVRMWLITWLLEWVSELVIYLVKGGCLSSVFFFNILKTSKYFTGESVGKYSSLNEHQIGHRTGRQVAGSRRYKRRYVSVQSCSRLRKDILLSTLLPCLYCSTTKQQSDFWEKLYRTELMKAARCCMQQEKLVRSCERSCCKKSTWRTREKQILQKCFYLLWSLFFYASILTTRLKFHWLSDRSWKKNTYSSAKGKLLNSSHTVDQVGNIVIVAPAVFRGLNAGWSPLGVKTVTTLCEIFFSANVFQKERASRPSGIFQIEENISNTNIKPHKKKPSVTLNLYSL